MAGSFGSLHVRDTAGPTMIGPLLMLISLAAALLGWLLLRRSGSSWRIGRLLSAAPQRDLADMAALAASGEEAYVRLYGRIDSDEEFPGIGDKPIVFRRRRLQRQVGRSRWETFDDERLAVPFRLSERGDHVLVDVDGLGDGLVVVPHEAEGVAADLREEHASGSLPDLPPDTPVRLRIDEVSSVEHATAAGVPRQTEDGTVVLGPGLGRPLLLTTLELDEAMRVLAGERRTELLVASGLLVAAPLLLVFGFIALVVGQ